MTINPVIIVSANDIAFPTPTAEDKLRLAVAGYLSKYKGKTLSGHNRGGKSHDRNSTHRVSSFIADM